MSTIIFLIFLKKFKFPILQSSGLYFKIKKWAEARRKGEKVKKPQPVALSYFIRLPLKKVHFSSNFMLNFDKNYRPTGFYFKFYLKLAII